MVTSSLSILSSPSSFPSTSSTDPSNYFNPSKKNLSFLRPIKQFPPKIASLRVTNTLGLSSRIQPEEENGSAKQILQDNKLADFVRFKRGNNDKGVGGGQLQTALVSYRKKLPWFLLRPFLQVDLVSTVHMADKDYFLTLQKELESYDCVLYEMVATRETLENRRNPATAKARKGSRSNGFNIIGFIQRQMAKILRLDYQLDFLDYQAENWYHADLDYETFKLLQLEKGESLFTLAREMALRSTKDKVERDFAWLLNEQPTLDPENHDTWRSKLLWASRVVPMPLLGIFIIGSVCADVGGQAGEYPELEALSMLDISSAMKVFLAKQLTSEFAQLTADVEEGSVLIGERNRAATEALRRAINNGHNRIAILYGGGHMPDLGRRLQDEFDLIPAEVQWITAWSIRNRDVQSSSLPFLKTMAEISGWPLNRYETLALLILSSVLALDLLFWELICGTAAEFISQILQEISQGVTGAQM